MTLYESWLVQAYNKDGSSIPKFWDVYMPLEQGIYEDIIENKIETISNTVEGLAKKYNMKNEFVCGFIDGVNDCIDNPIDMENITETTEFTISINFERLFKKMVEYKAEHLYSLKQWENIFDAETLEKFYREQKISRTVVKEDRVGRNDPCPCGSGKKYKVCCGA